MKTIERTIFLLFFLTLSFTKTFSMELNEKKTTYIFPLCNKCCLSYRKLCNCIINKQVYIAIVSPDYRSIDSSFGHVFFLLSDKNPFSPQNTAISWSNSKAVLKFNGYLFVNRFYFLKKKYKNRQIHLIKLNINRADKKTFCRKIWEIRKQQINYNPLFFNCASFVTSILKETSAKTKIRKHLILTPISLYKDLNGQNVPWNLGTKVTINYRSVELVLVYSGQLENQISFSDKSSKVSGFFEFFKIQVKNRKIKNLYIWNKLNLEKGYLSRTSLFLSSEKKLNYQIEKGLTFNKLGTISLNLLFSQKNKRNLQYAFSIRKTFKPSMLFKLSIEDFIGIKFSIKNFSFTIKNLRFHKPSRQLDFGITKVINF